MKEIYLPSRPLHSVGCEHCFLPDDAHVFIICDSCERGWHIYCLDPPLQSVPKGDWLCQDCKDAGVDLSTLRTIRATFQLQRESRQQSRAKHGRLRNHRNAAPLPAAPLPVAPLRMVRSPDPAKAKKFKKLQSLHTSASILTHWITAPTSVIDLIASTTSWQSAGSHPTLDQLQYFLQVLIPGEWPSAHLLAMCRALSLHSSLDGDLYASAQIPTAALQSLLSQIDLCFSPSVVALAVVSPSLPELVGSSLCTYTDTSFLDSSLPVVCNCNIFHPASLGRLLARYGSHVLVSSPHLVVADLAVPLLSATSRHAAAFLLPLDYLLAAPAPRLAWLLSVESQGRLVIASTHCASSAGSSFIWLIVFTSRLLRDLIYQPRASSIIYSLDDFLTAQPSSSSSAPPSSVCHSSGLQ